MTKYRKEPQKTAKDHKGALHRTTDDRQYHKGTLRAKLQEIGTN